MLKVRSKLAIRACKKASVKNNIPLVVIEEIFYQYYKMIAETINNADYDNPDSFLSFNLPKLGKLYVSKNKLKRLIDKGYGKSNNKV